MNAGHFKSSPESSEQQASGTFNPAGAPKISDVSESEFGRFRALTSKLIGVPKKEIDKKRKDES